MRKNNCLYGQISWLWFFPFIIFIVQSFKMEMEPIQITRVHFYEKENAKTHHTDMYDLIDNPSSNISTAILRRGAAFHVALEFDRPFNEEVDTVRLRFEFGSKPSIQTGTRIVRKLNLKQKKLPADAFKWGIIVSQHQEKQVVVNIQISANAPIGIWNFFVQTNIPGKNNKRYDYKYPDDIYVLFNPWSEDDGVYLEDEKEREEYILNESGKIWCGTFKQPKGKHWIFGQFEEVSLPAAVFLLEKSGLSANFRGSPVSTARAISAVINSVDDDGLLEGKWDNDYSDGTSPHAWTGSVPILEEYLSTGGTPVKYGQCWVFSAATVTVCRALGIPCRSTTNYISAHDTNSSLTVDKYFDEEGNKIETELNNDSCWNFHVWNDVWMTRPDLPKGYGGWQIIDATPQEQSEKIMRCGPASVAAVKKGEIGFLYDTPFVFSEVNADVIHFHQDDTLDSGYKVNIKENHVGRKILTKRLGPTDDKGDGDMLDVTSIYKNPERSEADRLVVYNAIKGVPSSKGFYDIPNQIVADVAFDLLDIETVPFGDSFNVDVRIQNNSTQERNIKALLSACSIYYNGSAAHDIKKSQGDFKVAPGGKQTMKITITPAEYIDKMVDHGLVKIYAITNVKETKQIWSDEDDFTMINPEVTITVVGLCQVGQQCEVTFSFRNPLDIALTNCSYIIEGPGLKKPKSISYRDVKPKEMVNLSENFTAKKSGVKKIVVNFTSKQIQHIHGSTSITIVE